MVVKVCLKTLKVALIVLVLRLLAIVVAVYLVKPLYFVSSGMLKHIVLTNASSFKSILFFTDLIWGGLIFFVSLTNVLLHITLDNNVFKPRLLTKLLNIKLGVLLKPIHKLYTTVIVHLVFSIIVLIFILRDIFLLQVNWSVGILPFINVLSLLTLAVILLNKQIDLISLYNKYAY